MSARTHRSVTCLGVGDGFPAADRGHAAFLYRLGGTRLLVDCGEPATRGLLRSGASLQQLDRVFISHLHFDHVGGLLTLLQSLWLGRRERPLTVHLPGVGIRPIQALMRTALLFDDWQPFPLRFEALRAWQPVPVGTGTVTAVPSAHLRALSARRGAAAERLSEAFSFILEDGGCRAVHSADLGGVEDLPDLLREPLDLFVCELAHLDPEDLFRALRGRPIRQLALVHLPADRWRHRRRWLARASRVLAPIRVHIPDDGTVVRF